MSPKREIRIYKCNQYGNGYRRKENMITTFEEQTLYLKKIRSYETSGKIQPSDAGSNRSSEATTSPAALGIKRKIEKSLKGDKSTYEAQINLKRVKNESENVTSLADEVDGETSVEESIFSDDLLLRSIFSGLNLRDLKHCRLVNHLWNFEATKIILGRDCLAEIEILDNTVKLHDASVYKLPIALSDFQNTFTSSKLFPNTGFAVNNHPLTSNIEDFFRDHGHLVKSFCILNEPVYRWKILYYGRGQRTRLAEILFLAINNFPNLTKLKIEYPEDKESSATMALAIIRAPEMTNLHTLTLEGEFPDDIIELLLMKTPNLENIYLLVYPGEYFHFCFEILIKLKMIPRLRNMYFFYTPSSLEIHDQILKQNPRFSSIKIKTIGQDEIRREPVGRDQVGRILTEMFQQCSESLTEFGLTCLGHIPGLTFPVFPNVKRMGIDYLPMIDTKKCSYLSYLLPSGVDLAQTFPNLAIVQFKFSRGFKTPENVFVKPLSPLLSVRDLEVSWGERYIPEIWAEKIYSLFPNVISAKFCNPIWNAAYEFVWKFCFLQDLHLAIESRPNANLLCRRLDSAFTGFSVETVKDLHKKDSADLHLSAEEVAGLRIKPSIVDLKDLRKLSLSLFDASVKEDWEDKTFGDKNVEVEFDPGDGIALLKVGCRTILSYVSKRFGFDLCPRLDSNVSLGFTHFTQLDDVES